MPRAKRIARQATQTGDTLPEEINAQELVRRVKLLCNKLKIRNLLSGGNTQQVDSTIFRKLLATYANNDVSRSIPSGKNHADQTTKIPDSLIPKRPEALCGKYHTYSIRNFIRNVTRRRLEITQFTFASFEKRRNASGSMPSVKNTLVSPQKSRSSDPKYAGGSTNTTAARKARRSSTDPKTQHREDQVIIHPRALFYWFRQRERRGARVCGKRQKEEEG